MWCAAIGMSIAQCEFQHGRNRRRAHEAQKFDNFAAKSLLQETQMRHTESERISEAAVVARHAAIAAAAGADEARPRGKKATQLLSD